MKKKQNSIDWLINQLQKSKDFHRVLNEVSQMSTARIDIIGQAKAMHKEEVKMIIEHYHNNMFYLKLTEKELKNITEMIYKETFGDEKEML